MPSRCSGNLARLRLRSAASTFTLVLLAAACGGGHDLQPDDGAARFYDTPFFRGGRSLAVLTFEGGLTYGFYQSDFSEPPYPEYVYAGFFVSQAPSGAGSDYDFENGATTSIQLELGTQAGTDVRGTIRRPPPMEDFPFTIRESANARLPTNPVSLPGTYAVQARGPAASFKAVATLDQAHNLSVTSGACTLAAKLSPRRLGNLYDVTATIGPSCGLGEGAFSGHAVQAYVTPNIYLFLTAPGQHGVMLLLVPNAP